MSGKNIYIFCLFLLNSFFFSYSETDEITKGLSSILNNISSQFNNQFSSINQKVTTLNSSVSDDLLLIENSFKQYLGFSVFQQRISSFGTTNLLNVAYGNGRWVAVGNSGKIALSDDGINWRQASDISIFSLGNISSVEYGNGIFLAGNSNHILGFSLDGDVWTEITGLPLTSGEIFVLKYGNGLWVMGTSGNVKLATSTDGKVWTERGSFSSSVLAATYGNGLWVVGGSVGTLATSQDGINWTSRTNPFATDNINDIYFYKGVFVAVGGNGIIAISSDGINWSKKDRSIFSGSTLFSVASHEDLWLVVGQSGKLAYSSDYAMTWTLRSSSFGSTDIHGLAVNDNAQWVAVGSSGKLGSIKLF